MHITSDNFPLYIAFVCVCLSFLACLFQAITRIESLAKFARVAYYISAAAVAYASVYLMQSILSGQRYDLEYIAYNSSPVDGLLYQVSAFWAGKEGSLLLWALFGAVIGVLLICKLSRVAPVVVGFWCSVQIYLLTLLVIEDPFHKYAQYQPGMSGFGLNPLLKNVWMATHPPVIFLGYALLAVPAAFAIQALITGDTSKWARKSMPWALWGWSVMTVGLVLGMVWAYQVLGWGGYWGWDPVENASLIPWLISTALVHGLIIQRYRGRMANWNIVLAALTFVAVLYAAFLTRSGVLGKGVSVHAFTEQAKGFRYLSGFTIFYAVAFIAIIAARWKVISGSVKPVYAKSKDFVVSLGIIVLALFAAVVVTGTSYTTFNPKAVLEPRFYTHMTIPLAVIIAALIVLATFMKWGGKGFVGIRTKLSHSGSHIAHLGVLLVILGIVFSSNGGDTRSLTLTMGDSSSKALGYEFAYAGKRTIDSFQDNMMISVKNGAGSFMAPITIKYSQGKSAWFPYISSSLAEDLYISPVESKNTIISPIASVTDKGWVASPVKIPGTDATLTLAGMDVESDMARLEYNKPNSKPIIFSVAANAPAKIDGYTFAFQRFVSSGKDRMVDMTAGVEVVVTGQKLAEKVIINVSKKPLISLLWIGAALMFIGGAMAAVRRGVENGKSDHGILPDSDGSDEQELPDSGRGRSCSKESAITP